MQTDNLEDFVRQIIVGHMAIASGGPDAKTRQLVEGVQPMQGRDVESITAEAFNQDVLEYRTTSWDAGLRAVMEVIRQHGWG